MKNRYWLGFATALAVLAAAGLVLVAGGYDVAATSPHTRPVAWLLDTTMHNSVQRRSNDAAPMRFDDAQVRDGFVLYRQACMQCHGAPGRAPDDWTRGMRPEPPALSIAARQWEPAEIHWILKHGIRMSGMPSFGALLDDRQLWQVVAFLKSGANQDAARWAALERELGPAREAAVSEPPIPAAGTPQAGAAAAAEAARQRAEQEAAAQRAREAQARPRG